MLHGIFLSLIILIFVVAFFVIDFWFMYQYDPERSNRKGWSWDYTLFTIVLGIAVILQPWLLPSVGWTTSHPIGLAIQFVGFIVLASSLIIHAWARRYLRQFYVERVEIQENHRVIRSGPYEYVRHPIITTFFGFAVGLFMINPSLVTILIATYTFWDFSRAARQEDELLSQSLPEYAEYMRTTSRFIPSLRKKT